MPNTQITDEASEWFVTLRHEQPDPTVHERFMAWLRTSPEHVRAYLGIVALWSDLPDVDPQCTPDAKTLIARARNADNVVSMEGAVPVADAGTRPPLSRAPRGHRFTIAASVTVFALAAGAMAWFQTGRVSTYATAIGEQRSFSLADGSTVELNSHSRIRIRFDDRQRSVELVEGQALFQVAKDRDRPFIVRTGDTSVRAVGTQFDVYRRQIGTTVTVLEGQVAILPPPAAATDQDPGTVQSPILLSAGEQVVLNARVAPQPKSVNTATATAWTHRQLIFKSTPLSAVVEEFNRYNTRRVVMGSGVEDFPITAVFSTTDPGTLVEFLKDQPGIDVRQAGDAIQIAPAPAQR